MARLRLTVLLPVIAVLITFGLWQWSLEKYESRLYPKAEKNALPVMWTDYTPVPLEIAGAINVPVATFGYPLYHLLHDETKTRELIALLVGVAVQWGYLGFAVDTRKTLRAATMLGRVASALGFLFGVFILLVTIPMHHVSAFYKFAAVAWSLLICVHFITALSNRKFVPELLL